MRNKFIRVKSAKSKSKSSTKWLQRQLNDEFVIKAKKDGYRSRAAYKLIEINNKFNIIQTEYNVVDLGAAPGGWSQVVAEIIFKENNKKIKHKKESDIQSELMNKVVALDLLPIEPITGVTILQQDFYQDDTIALINASITGSVNLVLSDMAANTVGHKTTDHLKIIDLCEQAFEFAIKILQPGGHFVAKILQGGTEKLLLDKIKKHFKVVKHFKPNSSRVNSSEIYVVALELK